MQSDVFNQVKIKLDSLGYKLKQEDLPLLENLNGCCDEYIKSFCSIEKIPDELLYARADMICGEFLLNKKTCGQLDIESLCFDDNVKSIQEGDVSVVFGDNASDAQKRAEALIEHLIYRLGKELLNYRCVKWN